MPNYTIRVLDWNDFDDLVSKNKRYEYAADSWAFADPRTETAYVRHTPSVLFNELTIAHELEHLVNPDDLHKDKHGIMHKKFFKQVALPALGAIVGSVLLPGIGTAIGGTLSGLGTGLASSLGAGLGAGLGAKAGGASTSGAVQTGLISGALQGVSLLGKGLTTARPTSGGVPPGGVKATLPGGQIFTGTEAAAKRLGVPPDLIQSGTVGGTGGAITAPSGRNITGSVAGQQTQLFGPPGGLTGDLSKGIIDLTTKGIRSLTDFGKSVLGLNTQGTAAATGATASSQVGKFGYGGFGNLAPVLAGTGLLAASSQFKAPEPPSYEELISPVQSRLTEQLLGGKARNPAAQAATGELQRLISSPFGEAFGPIGQDPYVQEAKRQNQINYYGDQETGRPGLRDQIINRYGALGHFEGRSGSLDSLLERMDQEFLRGQDQLDKEAQFRAQETEKTSRFQAIQLALGLEESQMRDLVNLANIDVSVAALKYGIEVEEARAIRDLFGQAGGLAIASGILGKA